MNAPEEILVAEACRLAELRGQAVLDTPTEPAFDRMTKLAARLLSTPVALVSFVDQDRQWFKSALGLPEPYATLRETPLSHSFCKTVVARMKDLAAVVTTELRLRKLLAEHEVEQVELKEAKRKAEDAVRIRGTFLSRFSHELRTPLNAVLGFGEILESELAEEGQTARAEYAHSIVSSGQHLLNLTAVWWVWLGVGDFPTLCPDDGRGHRSPE